MELSALEKWMYRVMSAIYESGIPIDFKGAMVLKACLLEAGYPHEIRHTLDIDANWYTDTDPSSDQMVKSLEKALQKSGIDLAVRQYRMYGERRSAGFELLDPSSDEVLFTMDVDVNRPLQPTKIYEVTGFQFRGVASYQMLADKISAISTDKVFQRIKDVVDLYYLAQVFELDRDRLLKTMESSGRLLGDFDGFLNGVPSLRHAYNKFRFTGEVNKPDFEDVYETVHSYVRDIVPMRDE